MTKSVGTGMQFTVNVRADSEFFELEVAGGVGRGTTSSKPDSATQGHAAALHNPRAADSEAATVRRHSLSLDQASEGPYYSTGKDSAMCILDSSHRYAWQRYTGRPVAIFIFTYVPTEISRSESRDSAGQ